MLGIIYNKELLNNCIVCVCEFRWMATKADRATYDKLIRALHHCSRSDQALHVAEILRRSLRPSESECMAVGLASFPGLGTRLLLAMWL